MNSLEAKPRNLLFESLRGLAAFMVLVFHMRTLGPDWWQASVARYGWVGVRLFFALSGFLIARSILTPATFSWKGYAESRARRILPAYFANLLILIAVANPKFLATPGWAMDLGIHAVLLHAWFGDGIMGSINGVYWTLSHEWCFYIFMGLTAVALRRAGWGWSVGVGLLLVSVIARWGWIREMWSLPNGSSHPLCICGEFGFGVLAAGFCQQMEEAGKSLRPRWGLILLVLGGAMLAYGLYRVQAVVDGIDLEKMALGRREEAIRKAFSGKRSMFLWANLLISLGCAAVVLVGWCHGHLVSRWLRFTPLPWMGRMSYSTYLWHVPILLSLELMKKRVVATEGLDAWLLQPWSFVLGALILIYLISYVSYRGFELPYFKGRQLTQTVRVASV